MQRGSGTGASTWTVGAYSWWALPTADALLTGVLPQQQRFREQTRPEVELCLSPDDEVARGYALHAVASEEHGRRCLYTRIDAGKHHDIAPSVVAGSGIEAWGESDYLEALQALSERMGISIEDCAKRYGTVNLPASTNGWSFHPALGFAACR